MAKEISILFPEHVWQAIVHYEPLATGPRLSEATRRRLHDAVAIGHPEPVENRGRVVTVIPEQADALQAWLQAASQKPTAPAAVASAAPYVEQSKRAQIASTAASLT